MTSQHTAIGGCYFDTRAMLSVIKKTILRQIRYGFVISVTVVMADNVLAGSNSGNFASAVELAFSDGRPALHNISNINRVLNSAGVNLSPSTLASEATPMIEASKHSALTPEQYINTLQVFSLNRDELLDEIAKAGRSPGVEGGGELSVSEKGTPPYPKVYDMKSMSKEQRNWVNNKFSKLHVNLSEEGVSVDELMTLVSGGPWTWFFVLPDNVISKLTIGAIGFDNEMGWRLSYPGSTPHGAFMDTEFGLVVAHVIGPKEFVVWYELEGKTYSELLDTNPWLDPAAALPVVLDKAID